MSILLFAFLGGVAGAVLSNGPGGFWAGAAIGALGAWVNLLSRRVQHLEQRVDSMPADTGAAARPTAEREPERPARDSARTPAAAPATARPPTAAAAAAQTPAYAAAAQGTGDETRPPPSTAAGSGRRPAPRVRSAPSLPEIVIARIRRWFTTGNVPVKVGVVLSVFGVGFLVKEAIDRNWMSLPIELRLVLVALFGLALLVVGWRLRDSHRTYAVSVQGGGVAVLYLTIYASFALYGLLPAALAFALLLIVTAAVGALAVLQNARALAVLGVVGGFMAPVLTSSGSGSHVALFGYYAVLNAAIIGIAWFRSWRELNVLGFFFTFGIASLWGFGAYRPEYFASTEPFLVLFVLMYTLIPVMFATRSAPNLKGFVDGTLLFGTPIVGFGLQTRLVGDTEYGLALSAAALAALYVGLATFLFRRGGQALRVLIEALFSLAVVFLTIAVPLALDAQWTSAAWALEGAAMIWLGLRQRQRLALASGVALQLAAGVVHFATHYDGGAAAPPIVNGAWLGAALIAAAGALSSFLADRSSTALRSAVRDAMAAGFLVWAAAWWLGAGLVEIDRQVPFDVELAASLAFVAATVVFTTVAAPRLDWPRLATVGLVGLPAIVVGALVSMLSQPHPLAGYGWAAWPVMFAAHALFLRRSETRYRPAQPVLHAGAYFVLAGLVAAEIHWQVDRFTTGAWPSAAAAAGVALLVLATLRAAGGASWPFDAHRNSYVVVGVGAVLAALLLGIVALNLSSPGDADPLPFVPLLNPLELASVLAVIVLVRTFRAWRDAGVPAAERIAQRGGTAAPGTLALALLALLLLTMSVARAVHHFAGVPFDLELLARSTILQAALSIVWGTTAFACMLLGARGRRRIVWLAGAALMTIVVAKLFLVELGNAGTVGRVVSFLGVGVLLLVVGYFAPVPPRDRLADAST